MAREGKRGVVRLTMKLRASISAQTFDVLQPLKSFLPEIQAVATVCVKSHENAYAPYSKFFVGAALLHSDGSVTAGCNYENCIYQGTCAERCAIVSANCGGKRTAELVAVYGRSIDSSVPAAPPQATCPPCGFCRQLLVEVAQLSGVDLPILLITHSREEAKLVRLSTLLPSNFGPLDLGLDIEVWSDASKQMAAVAGHSSATPKKKRDREN